MLTSSGARDVLQPVTSVRECAACGAWSGDVACPLCQSDKWAASSRGASNRAALRSLVDLTICADGVLEFQTVTSARMPWLANDQVLASRLRAVTNRAPLTTSFNWTGLLDELDAICLDYVVGLLGAAFATESEKRRAIVVSTRVSSHSTDPPSLPVSGAEVRSYEKALAANGQITFEQDLRVEGLSLLPGAPSPTLTTIRAVLVTGLELHHGDDLVWHRSTSLQTAPDEPGSLPSVRPPGPALRRLMQARQAGQTDFLALHVQLLGRPDVLVYKVDLQALEGLPAPHELVDIFLDVGSTTTKSLVRSPSAETWHFDATKAELERFGNLPAFDKAALMLDASGYATWVSESLERLDQSAVAGGHYLNAVHLVFPSQAVLTEACASHGLQAAAARHLVSSSLTILAEWQALADHYLPVVDEFAQLELTHESKHHKLHKRYGEQHAVWKKRHARTEGFFGAVFKFFDDPGAGPTRPTALESLGLLKAYLSHANRNDYLLLDAGGLSLDAAFVVSGRIDTELSCGLSGVGGEDVSRIMGLLDTADSHAATATKAQLGRNMDTRDPVVRGYRDATAAVYRRPLARVLNDAARTWPSAPLLVLVSGGASRNPFFRKELKASLHQVGLEAEVIDAEFMSRAAGAAETRRLDVPRLEAFQRIAAQEGRGLAKEAMCGRFDLIGGLWARDGDA